MKTAVFLVIILLTLSSCSSIGMSDTPNMSDTPKPIEINGSTYDKYTLWECREPYGESKVILEFINIPDVTVEEVMPEPDLLPAAQEELSAEELEALKELKVMLDKFFNGYVLFDGRKDYARAHYYRQGISHRWDWEGTKYSFVIEPDGTGLYYDFSSVKKGETTRARDLFKCNMAHE